MFTPFTQEALDEFITFVGEEVKDLGDYYEISDWYETAKAVKGAVEELPEIELANLNTLLEILQTYRRNFN